MRKFILNAAYLTAILASAPGLAQTATDADAATPPTGTQTAMPSEPTGNAPANSTPAQPGDTATPSTPKPEVTQTAPKQEIARAQIARELGVSVNQQYSEHGALKGSSTSLTPTDDYAEALEKLRTDYKKARELFGETHVALFPMFYSGRQCADEGRTLFRSDKCETESENGVAGVIFVPVWGAGGGHGPDLWPVLDTEDEAQAFETFEQRIDRLVKAIDALSNAGGAVSNTHVELLAALVEDVLQRDIDEDGDAVKESQASLASLQELTNPSVDAKHSSELALKLRELRLIWEKYRKPAAKDNKRRHNFLLGPSYGIPLTKDVANAYLLGATAELGGASWGLSFNLGLRQQFDGGFPLKDAQGWYAGLGFSGELADDLLNLFTGAATAGAKLKGIPNGQ